MNKITLAGCVILDGNKILLLHRIKNDWYELPGGKLMDSESPEKAAEREVKEELGCGIEILRRLGKKDFEQDGRHFTYHWFLAKIRDGPKPRIGEPEQYDHLKYITIDELKKYNLSTDMKNLADEITKNKIKI